MCANFGKPFDPDDPESTVPNADRHYTLSRVPGRCVCRYCEKSFGPKVNDSIRPIVRYFLSLSLPFATCPDETCSNYGVNVFEHYARPGSAIRRRYGRSREHQVRCLGCPPENRRHVGLGTPFSMGRNSEVDRTIAAIRRSVLVGTKKRRTVFFDDIEDANYLGRLRRMGARVQDYQTWLNARFLSPEIQRELDYGSVARVQTDVMDIPLRRTGDISRQRQLRYIFSVLVYKKTFYVLAAHPNFIPADFLPKNLSAPDQTPSIDPVTGGPCAEFARRWDCLEHPVHNEFSLPPKTAHKKKADMSRFGQGFYIRRPYLQAAHFMVVRKMLSRFEKVCFFIDGDRPLIQGAMVGLADAIRSHSVEVVVHQKKKRSKASERALLVNAGPRYSEKRLNLLRSRWKAAEKRLQERVEGYDETKPGDVVAQLPQQAAKACRGAPEGAWAGAEWAWTRFPEFAAKGLECRTLWLTRMPGKTFEEAEEFLRYSSIQSVDSMMDMVREWARGSARPGQRAQKGRNYRRRYFDPRSVQAELAIYLLSRNFFYTSKGQPVIPAENLGLMAPSSKDLLTDVDAIKNFQLDLTHAELMTQWRHQ